MRSGDSPSGVAGRDLEAARAPHGEQLRHLGGEVAGDGVLVQVVEELLCVHDRLHIGGVYRRIGESTGQRPDQGRRSPRRMPLGSSVVRGAGWAASPPDGG